MRWMDGRTYTDGHGRSDEQSHGGQLNDRPDGQSDRLKRRFVQWPVEQSLEQTEGQTTGCTNGRSNGRSDRQSDRWSKRQSVGHSVRRMVGGTNGWTVDLMDGRTDGGMRIVQAVGNIQAAVGVQVEEGVRISIEESW